jgi:hypothetical protein
LTHTDQLGLQLVAILRDQAQGPGHPAHVTRNGRALRDHVPDTSTALGDGRISPQHASAITSVVATVGVDHATTAEPSLLGLDRCNNAYERRGLTLTVVIDEAAPQGRVGAVTSPDTGQPGRFWASTAGWVKPAQTAADRSPPITLEPA